MISVNKTLSPSDIGRNFVVITNGQLKLATFAGFSRAQKSLLFYDATHGYTNKPLHVKNETITTVFLARKHFGFKAAP